MRIQWTRQAVRDLAEIQAYIEEDKPVAARRVAAHLLGSVEHLAVFPELGRAGRRQGTRELSIPPYIVTYRVRARRLQILSVWHARRRRPRTAR